MVDISHCIYAAAMEKCFEPISCIRKRLRVKDGGNLVFQIMLIVELGTVF